MRVTLDTNILIYALHVDDLRNGRAVEIVARAARADCILTMQALAECFNVLVNKRHLEPAAACKEINKFRLSLDCIAAAPVDLDMAMNAVVSHKLSFWDAMLWATAKRADCRIVLTEDVPGLPELEGVGFLDPFKPENEPRLDLALPPLEP